jgi:hypothetical protein
VESRGVASLRRTVGAALHLVRPILPSSESRLQYMTSLIAWIGVDARGAASAYFASDSRITWPGVGTWDHGRKLFACRRYPHMLGYCGDVLFPTQTLSQISEMVDADLLATASERCDICLARVASVLSTALETYPAAVKREFDVLYCIREGEGVPSRFHLWQLTFAPSASPRVSLISMPESSAVVAILGSGAPSVHIHLKQWDASDAGGTSRAAFSAFCDSLDAAGDPHSAGPPQLVGLWRKGAAQTFGMIWEQRRYFYGTEVNTIAVNDVRCYNSRFELCDPYTLARKPGAQPQPRPKGLRRETG